MRSLLLFVTRRRRGANAPRRVGRSGLVVDPDLRWAREQGSELTDDVGGEQSYVRYAVALSTDRKP
jgi:hypothetical protein